MTGKANHILGTSLYMTQGTNYSVPRTNDMMFYTAYNTNIVNGERSN